MFTIIGCVVLWLLGVLMMVSSDDDVGIKAAGCFLVVFSTLSLILIAAWGPHEHTEKAPVPPVVQITVTDGVSDTLYIYKFEKDDQ